VKTTKDVSVKIERVTKTFGRTVALNNVSFEVYQNEFLTLLGPSGCGKTTLLGIIAGFVKPTSGDIYIGNELVTDKQPNERKTGMVFQNYALFPHMNVYENLAFGLKLRKLGRDTIDQRIQEALKLIRLEGFEKRYPRQLSGGQQQRVALARAIVTQPDVLLLDEPLSNLDYKLRIAMRLELKRIQRILRKTTIYVTHDQSEALSMSDRIVVMDAGSVLQIGTPLEIYEHPTTRTVADFVGDANFFEARIVDLTPTKITVLTEKGARLSLLTFAGDLLHDSKIGDKISLLARPEKVVLSKDDSPKEGDEKENRVRGTILDTEYLGGTVRYYVDTKNLGIVKADMKNIPETNFQTEDQVFLEISKSDFLVLD